MAGRLELLRGFTIIHETDVGRFSALGPAAGGASATRDGDGLLLPAGALFRTLIRGEDDDDDATIVSESVDDCCCSSGVPPSGWKRDAPGQLSPSRTIFVVCCDCHLAAGAGTTNGEAIEEEALLRLSANLWRSERARLIVSCCQCSILCQISECSDKLITYSKYGSNALTGNR